MNEALANALEIISHIDDTTDAHDASAISTVPAGNLASTNVQTSLAELDSEKATTGSVTTVQTNLDNHINDSSDAHDASAISVVSTTLVGTGADVQAVLEELDNAIVAAESSVSNHLADTDSAHAASAISILDSANDFTATDVEGALAELQSDAEAALGQYRMLHQNSNRTAAGLGTTAFYLGTAGPYYATVAGVLTGVFYFDPADVDTANQTLKVKLDAWAFTETNPTDSTLTVTLVQVTAIAAGGKISTVGSAIATATLAPNAATTAYQAESAEADFGATAGYYIVQFAHSVDPAQAMTYGYTVQLRVA
jgi:hypothetical protein